MTFVVKLSTIIIIVIAQCVTVDTRDIKDYRALLQKKLEKLDGKKHCELCLFNNSISYKCHSDCFKWVQLESLKQWKRRRRDTLRLGLFHSRFIRSALSSDFVENKQRSLDVFDTAGTVDSAPSVMSLVAKFKEKWPVAIWRQYLFTDDYLTMINPHWLTFAPPDPVLNYAFGGFYIVMALFGGCGNAVVLVMYTRCRTLRTPGNILVANLALSDFFMLSKTPVFIFNSFNLGPALGKTGCIVYGFVGGLTGCTSIATLAAIALDRYWAVVRPLEPLRALTVVRAKIFAIGAWIYAGIFASIPALDIGYGRYVAEGYLTSCSFDYLTDELPPRYFIFVFFCAAWVLPFFTIFFCYLNILRVVVYKKNVASGSENNLSSRHVKEQTKRKSEMKLAVLVIAVIALFFISWTPYAVVALLGIFGKKDMITPLTSMIPALFCKTAACINPFIYIITHPTFRNEFRKMLKREKSERLGVSNRTIGYTEATVYHRPSKDLSDTDVEIVKMKDIPYHSNEMEGDVAKTVSGRVSERDGSQKSVSMKSVSMKSLEGEAVSPPSWFAKPQFSKKSSFQRRSTKSVVSFNTDPTVL